MSVLNGKSIIYEINTPVWLHGLSAQYGRPVTLADVPEDAVDALALPGISMIWMMGVWERSALGRTNALKYRHEYRAALPDLRDEDVIGSAYSISSYTVARAFGGRDGLAAFRRQLQARGLKLMLDYVPNHVGIDHPWVEQPGFIVRGSAEDAQQRPSDFFIYRKPSGRSMVLAHGRDPYFPGWSDTAQLNIFDAKLRAQIKLTLADIASQCDGLRCDMAMLLLNDIFAATWHGHLKSRPRREFWAEVIPTVRALYPEFIFLAEVYWGKESDLLALGFDYVYDKVFYDRLITGDATGLRQHLIAPAEYQRHTVRFIENHDEPRAFAALGPQRSFPAATVLLTVPGAALLHDGQFTGRHAKLPVQIGRAPLEPVLEHLQQYYLRLLQETTDPVYHHGEFTLFHIAPAAPGTPTHGALLAYGWHLQDDGYRLIVVNLGAQHAWGRVDLTPWETITGRNWRLYDVIDGAEYLRRGDELSTAGLYISLEACETHIFRFEPAPA
jgi:hypothetical protein